MSDLYSFDLLDGIAKGKCPLCYAVDLEIRRWLDSFCREGRRSPDARRQFFSSSGFCRRHSWLLYDLSSDQTGAAIADLYGLLCSYDLTMLDDLLARGRRRNLRQIDRQKPCSACVEETNALERKAAFFVELLQQENARHSYEHSAGLCRPHLLAVLQQSDEKLSRYLLADWRTRLSILRHRLAEYDRKRDHRFATERTADDERSCSDAISQYVGTHPE